MNHVESHVKIFFTTNYGQFKFLKGNRDINEAKVKKIIRIIKEGVDILKYAPIIVNDKMEIIDGQHRFVVSKMLKRNVSYVIAPEADISTAPSINSNSSNWTTKDYLNSYVDMAKENYIAIAKFVKDYPGVSISTAATMFHTGYSEGQEAMTAFKEGILTNTHEENTCLIFDELKKLKPYTNNPYARRLVRVVGMLLKNGKYNHELMIEKLKLSGRRIENVNSPKELLMEMESIINFKARKRILIH